MKKKTQKRSQVTRQKKANLQRSNAAHARLERKARNEWLNAYNKQDYKGMKKAWIKSMYHSDVWVQQCELERKLTAQEKKSHYNTAVFWVEDETRFWEK